MPIVIPISIFVFIVLGSVALYWLLFRPPSAASERIEQLRKQTHGDDPAPVVRESTVARLAERVAEPINRIAPPSAKEAGKLQKKLMHAGYRSPKAPAIYRAIQVTALFGFPLAAAFVLMGMGRPLSGSLGWLMGALGAGYITPRYILDNKIGNRRQRLTWGLADALDLLVVSVEAGLGVNQAMVRVSEELKTVHPDISEEFELVNLEIRVGREREVALRNLAERTGVEDLRGLCAMLIQADRFGTSIARAIRVYSDSLRTKRRQRAEQTAQKAAIKLLIPLALFLFPTLFIVILGPAFLQLMDNFIRK
ncbi:MAG: type II secretion system F family protein [Blastocatellia bacterium]